MLQMYEIDFEIWNFTIFGRCDSGDWYNISDAMKPIRINEPVVSFLYLLMKDAPPMY